MVVLGLGLVGLTPMAHAQSVFSQCLSNGAAIDSNLPPVVETIAVSGVTIAGDVQVTLDLAHTFQGDLAIDLEGPNGVTVRLHDRAGSGADNINLIYSDVGVPSGTDSFTCGCLMAPAGPGTLQSLLSAGANGNWTLTVDDQLGGDQGTLTTWCIDIFEQTPPVPIQSLVCLSTPGSGFADVTWTNPVAYDSINIYVNGSFVESVPGGTTLYTTTTFPTPSMITVAVEAVVGVETTVPISCTLTLPEEGATVGPDVTYQDCTSITRFGAVGTTHAYALGSFTCNRGPENLVWGSTSPLLAMNAYRINDGRLEQIGMSWVKNGTVEI